jgi:hypothetical protein
MLPSFQTYCPNTGPEKALQIFAGGSSFWFSYRTCIAFKVAGGPVVVCQNEWGPTTGKHLNAIDDDHDTRLPVDAFRAALAAATA